MREGKERKMKKRMMKKKMELVLWWPGAQELPAQPLLAS
jgi:hypothetical protein